MPQPKPMLLSVVSSKIIYTDLLFQFYGMTGKHFSQKLGGFTPSHTNIRRYFMMSLSYKIHGEVTEHE